MKYKKGDMVLVNIYRSKTMCFIKEVDTNNEFPYEVFCYPSCFSRCKEEDIIEKIKDSSEFWFNDY